MKWEGELRLRHSNRDDMGIEKTREKRDKRLQQVELEEIA